MSNKHEFKAGQIYRGVKGTSVSGMCFLVALFNMDLKALWINKSTITVSELKLTTFHKDCWELVADVCPNLHDVIINYEDTNTS